MWTRLEGPRSVDGSDGEVEKGVTGLSRNGRIRRRVFLDVWEEKDG